jgi:hypothetical protein
MLHCFPLSIMKLATNASSFLVIGLVCIFLETPPAAAGRKK